MSCPTCETYNLKAKTLELQKYAWRREQAFKTIFSDIFLFFFPIRSSFQQEIYSFGKIYMEILVYIYICAIKIQFIDRHKLAGRVVWRPSMEIALHNFQAVFEN